MEKEVFNLYLENLYMVRLIKEINLLGLNPDPYGTKMERSITLATEQLLNVIEELFLHKIVDKPNTKKVIEQKLTELSVEIRNDKRKHEKFILNAFNLYYKTIDLAENSELMKLIVKSTFEISR